MPVSNVTLRKSDSHWGGGGMMKRWRGGYSQLHCTTMQRDQIKEMKKTINRTGFVVVETERNRCMLDLLAAVLHFKG